MIYISIFFKVAFIGIIINLSITYVDAKSLGYSIFLPESIYLKHIVKTNCFKSTNEDFHAMLKWLQLPHITKGRKEFLKCSLLVDILFIKSDNIAVQLEKLISKDLKHLEGKSVLLNNEKEHLSLLLDVIVRYKLNSFIYNIIPWLGYPIADVRIKVCQSLTNLADDRLFPIILKLSYSQYSEEILYVLKAMEYINDVRTFPRILELLEHPNVVIRHHALSTLSKLPIPQKVDKYISVLSRDDAISMQISAMEYITPHLPARVLSTLNKKLFSSSVKVRVAAIHLLSLYKMKSVIRYFSQALQKEKEPSLKIMMLKNMVESNSIHNGSGIAYLLENEREVHVLLWALYLAGKHKRNSLVYGIIYNLEHKDERVRVEALSSLAHFRNQKFVNYFLKKVENVEETFFVRSIALESIRYSFKSSVLFPLFNLYKTSPSLPLRFHIKSVLGFILKDNFAQ